MNGRRIMVEIDYKKEYELIEGQFYRFAESIKELAASHDKASIRLTCIRGMASNVIYNLSQQIKDRERT